MADEVVRLLSAATVRDRASGLRRQAVPSDIAVLFRSRDAHREFEKALEARGVSTYVYKRAFEWTTFDLGYASTVAAVWFVIVLATVLTLTWAFRQREKLEY